MQQDIPPLPTMSNKHPNVHEVRLLRAPPVSNICYKQALKRTYPTAQTLNFHDFIYLFQSEQKLCESVSQKSQHDVGKAMV